MKKYIIGFILGTIVSGSIVYATTYVKANEISYTDRNNNEITVENALNRLYNQADGVFESLAGDANSDRNTSSVNYTSTFNGRILVVMNHYTNGTYGTVKVNNVSVNTYANYTSPTTSGGYVRRVEYAVFDVVEGQSVSCSISNIIGGSASWSLSSCSLYRIG